MVVVLKIPLRMWYSMVKEKIKIGGSEMRYLGHKSNDGLNREQSLLEHLQGTSKLCESFAGEFTEAELGRILGLYHDIGKYSAGFQKRIQKNGPKVDHSTAGAQILFKQFPPLAFGIAGHHSGLMNLGTRFDEDNGTLWARINKSLIGKLDYGAFKEEVPEPAIDKKQLPILNNKFQATFLTRMLFSCLVDADFLDTEHFMRPDMSVRGDFDSLEHLYNSYFTYVDNKFNHPLPKNVPKSKRKIFAKRTEIRDECIKAARGEEGLYTLTVPTGGGKTIASLGFALEHAMTHKNKKRIIYVIPYTSIIEQTADVFREIVGDKNVIEHHMNVDYDDENAEKNGLGEDDSEKKKLATENWDAPIIVTTNVQFFESLYAKKTSRCRKLHNIANSIVIFDEAQMLPNEFLKPCTRAIQELVNNYHVTAVLCTATQPSLNQYFEQLPMREICKDVDGLYNFFRRVTYKNADFTDSNALITELNKHEQVLCIVNSKKEAQLVYDGLQGEGCYHLSTFMHPQHRRAVLNEVRSRLRQGQPCKLIATSLVEAGVDVDFPVVYRELAGLDSIIQAAGRCNRENSHKAAESIVYIFTIQDNNTKMPDFVKLPMEVTKMVVQKYADISSTVAIKEYFDRLHEYKGNEGLDVYNILGKSDKMLFSDIAANFKLIGDTGRSIFIPCDDVSRELLAKLRAGVRNRALMRKAGQYVVNVYDKQFIKLQGAGIIDVLDENISVLTDLSIYDEYKGLMVNVDEGIGVFF